MIYEFGPCRLDTATQQLWRSGDPVHVEPQVLAVLEYLVAHGDRVVTKIELMDQVWGDRFVSESALTSRIKLARKACGDSGREQRIVKTVHSRGYRVVVPVTEHGDDGTARRTIRAEAAESHRAPVGLVGREEELARLDTVLADAASGHRRTIFVCGEVGSGKSALVDGFLERHDHLEDQLVARGQCFRTRGGVEPYFVLLDALGHLARTRPDLVRTTLDRVAPTWLSQMPMLIDDEVAERLERRLLGTTALRMLREGAEALEALAQTEPLVLVLEDLQWADECSLDVLELLVQRRGDVPLALIGTSRPGSTPLESMIATAVASGQAEELTLDRLDRAALQRLIELRLDASPTDELVDMVADHSEGVPLFAEEILTSWVREGRLSAVGGTIATAVPPGDVSISVPTTLPALIERELVTLAPAELTVLEAAAVAGDTFQAASIAAGAEVPLGEAESVLMDLARHHRFLGAEGATTWPDGTVYGCYGFTHQLYRQVVYDRIPASRRAGLHGRIGSRLLAGLGDRAGEIAVTLSEHFVQANDAPAAVEFLRRSGEQAASRNAHAHAVDFLAAALDQAIDLPLGPERDRAELSIRMSLGPVLVATRGWFDESVVANYRRALALCPDDTCPEAASARYALATVSELHGDFRRTEDLLAPVLAAETDDDLAMAAHELVACSTFHQGAFDRSLENASAVLDAWDEDAYSVLMARIAEHPASSCNSWSSLAFWFLGHSDESLRRAELAVTLGERNLYALSTATQQRAMFHQLRNEPDSCLEWASRTREVGREQSFEMRVIQADIYRGWALGVSGDTTEGISLITEGLTRFRAEHATLNEAYYLGLWADALLHDDRAEDALGLLDEALGLMHATTRTYFYESELHRLRGRAALRSAGDTGVPRGREALELSLRVADGQGSPPLALRTLCDLVEMERRHGDPERWLPRLVELLAVYDGQQPVPDVVAARDLLDH